jgi:hypothetical protein
MSVMCYAVMDKKCKFASKKEKVGDVENIPDVLPSIFILCFFTTY